MERFNRTLSERRNDDPHSTLGAVPRRDKLRASRQAGAQALWETLVGAPDRRRTRADLPAGHANRERRRWDYRHHGYYDKPYLPRDYTKALSPELQKFYGEQEG